MTTTSDQLSAAWDHVRANRIAQAKPLFEEVLRRDARCANALDGLGWCAYRAGDFASAESLYQRCIEADPGVAEVYLRLASLYRTTKRWDEAMATAHKAVQLAPDKSNMHAGLGTLLHERRDFPAAAECYRRAIQISPNDPLALVNLSDVVSQLGDPIEGEALARRALKIAPDFWMAHFKLGYALERQARAKEAANAFARAAQLNPNDKDVHWNLSAVLLLAGEFEKAWPHFDARMKATNDPNAALGLYSPMWDGRPFPNQTLLVQAEQGLGDAIHFARYIPLVAQRGGSIIFRVHYPLVGLMKTLAGGATIVPLEETVQSHMHIPLLSLGRIFKTTLSTIPANVPYLFADDQRKATFAKQIEGDDVRIGIVWGGNPEHHHDRTRSIDPQLLAPLGEIEGVRWVSLQKGRKDKPLFKFLDLESQLNDFSDTAAAVANLDLVIGIDSSVNHLAGAMARPVWTLLPFAPDWRWLLAREDSPWYPTMRLLRQPARGDWKSVVKTLAADVREFVASKRRGA